MFDRLIERAVMGQSAFEQGEGVHTKGRAGHRSMTSDIGIDQAARPTEAGEGDMGQIGAAFRRKAGRDAGAIDFPMERRQWIVRFDASPERVDHALSIEHAYAGKLYVERGEADGGQHISDIVCAVPVDLADKPQGQMQVVVILPARALHIAHYRQEVRPVIGRWPDGDEQAVHRLYIDG